MIRVDFDVPSYLRLEQGLCIVSSRLAHKLPEHATIGASDALEPVVINKLYSPRSRKQVSLAPVQQPVEIKGEYLPRDHQLEQENNSLTDESAPSDKSGSEPTEINFQGVAGKSVTGEYRGSGFAQYRFLKKNGNSFFLRIGEHLVWGIELSAQLRQSSAKEGDIISLTFLGKTPVKVLANVPGKTEQEWVDTYRNSWEIKILK